MTVAHFVFGVFGNITGLTLFLVPVITFWTIIKSKSTQQFSGVPYVSALLNCLLCAWYGLPFVSPHNLLVSVVNGAGSVLELIYVIIFLIYANKNMKLRAKIFGGLMLVLGVFAGIALVSVLAFHGRTRKLICGFAASIVSICTYASPLSIMRLVIKTKSVKYMPFFLSLFVFLSCTNWFIYGLLGKDPFVAVSTGVGSFFGALQLILYAIYKDWKNVKGNEADGKNIDMESGAVENPKISQDKMGTQMQPM